MFVWKWWRYYVTERQRRFDCRVAYGDGAGNTHDALVG
jgi:hypothetical protein